MIQRIDHQPEVFQRALEAGLQIGFRKVARARLHEQGDQRTAHAVVNVPREPLPFLQDRARADLELEGGLLLRQQDTLLADDPFRPHPALQGAIDVAENARAQSDEGCDQGEARRDAEQGLTEHKGMGAQHPDARNRQRRQGDSQQGHDGQRHRRLQRSPAA